EYDHLEGGLYVDRLDARRHRKLLREAGRTRWGKAAGL
ncbi:peptide deformylase, partial [Streptomyces sp. SID11233]|nr:peptide deformylase [Streptomyces sp. SID11233]